MNSEFPNGAGWIQAGWKTTAFVSVGVICLGASVLALRFGGWAFVITPLGTVVSLSLILIGGRAAAPMADLGLATPVEAAALRSIRVWARCLAIGIGLCIGLLGWFALDRTGGVERDEKLGMAIVGMLAVTAGIIWNRLRRHRILTGLSDRERDGPT